MTVLEGAVEHVETEAARSFAEAAASISDTVVLVADVAPFLTESGSCTIDIDGVEYTATPDAETSSLTVSPALSVAVEDGDPIDLVPAAEIKWAYVSLGQEDPGDWLRCRVPHELVGYTKLGNGPRDPGEREAVLVETEPVPSIYTVLNQPTEIDASTTPIVVSNAEGESAQVDADGFSTYTNNPVPVRTIVGTYYYLTTDGTYLYARSPDGIHKLDPADGTEVTSGGFPILGSFDAIAHDGGFLYILDEATDDIRKFNASTGVETIGSGFPIAGTFRAFLAADGGFIYAVDDTTDDIRKFNASNGTQVLTGFPITGTFLSLAAEDGFLYAVDDTTDDIRKYDAATGAEDTSGFPIAGTFYDLSIANGRLFATEIVGPGGWIHAFSATTGEADSAGFPITGYYSNPSLGAFFYLAAGSGYLYARDQRLDVRLFNIAEGYQSTGVDSADGSAQFHEVRASDITASGSIIVDGTADIDNLLVTTTLFTRTAAQNIATGGTGALVDFDTAADSGDSAGATDYWSESGGTITVLVTGIYDLSIMAVLAANVTGGRRLQLSIAGSVVLDRFEQATSGTVNWTFPIALSKVPINAGETITLKLIQTSGGNLSCAGTWLRIARAGALAA